MPILQTRTPEEHVTGRTPDISEYAHYSFFEWVWYKDQVAFPEVDMKLGRWIGVATDVGQSMTYWLLTNKCTVIARSSVMRLHEFDIQDPIVIKQQSEFMQRIAEIKNLSTESQEPFIQTEDDLKFSEFSPEEEDKIYTTPEMDDFTPEAYDEYLLAQVMLPIKDSKIKALYRLIDHMQHYQQHDDHMEFLMLI